MLKAILFLSTRLELPASYRATKDIDVDHKLWRNMETHIFPSLFDCAVRYNVGKYAQVLHMADAKHWVAVTNVGANWGEVRYFDSLTLDVTHSTKCAIASK